MAGVTPSTCVHPVVLCVAVTVVTCAHPWHVTRVAVQAGRHTQSCKTTHAQSTPHPFGPVPLTGWHWSTPVPVPVPLTPASPQHYLTEIEVLAIIFAAAIHDYEHTGTTNSFHIQTK